LEQEFAVEREPKLREDFSPKAEEYTLLEAVTRQLLVKTLEWKRLVKCGDQR
jgi:hypothetical protein